MGKSSNGGALKEQKKANAQSQKNFERQMRLMQKQMEQAASVEVPKVDPIPPGPRMSSQDMQAAGRETRMQSRRRYGWGQSVSANNPNLGGSVAL